MSDDEKRLEGMLQQIQTIMSGVPAEHWYAHNLTEPALDAAYHPTNGMSQWNLRVKPPLDFQGFHFPAEFQFHGQITDTSARIIKAINARMWKDRR